ncbi:hypothetical protein [Vulcanisaeta distributa]|uniref:hypothetical protein n=1 Tax=Vulcanisaeta distributa TaxID=164451 RepID=UPI000AF8407A|nr:hypothetical protein [Vulcanisaeta distributa]
MFNSEVVDSSYMVWSTCTIRGMPAYWIFEGVPTIMPSVNATSFKLTYIAYQVITGQ